MAKRKNRKFGTAEDGDAWRETIKPGDRVRAGGHPAKVVEFAKVRGAYGAVVEYLNYGRTIWVPLIAISPIDSRYPA